MSIVVIGSGPAGVCAARAALENGKRVVMLDVGLTLDEATAARMQALGNKPPNAWTAEERAEIKHGGSLTHKRVFGSDFATQTPGYITEKNCSILRSHAKGGLSNIWGRGIEPPARGEIDHWPFKAELEVALKAVVATLPFAGEDDNLAGVFPLNGSPTPHIITPESTALLARWNTNKAALNARDIHFGKTRLALKTSTCQLCGLCFYGCVYNAMYSTSDAIAELQRSFPQFEYRAGVRVETFEVLGDGSVKVQAHGEEFTAEKLILACGAPETTALVMRSTHLTSTTMKTGEMFTYPLLRWTKSAGDTERFHALSQLTITFGSAGALERTAVMHLFGKNPLIEETLLKHMPKLLHPACKWLLNRLVIGMCFLHSDDSRSLIVTHANGVTQCAGVRGFCRLPRYFSIFWRLLQSANITGLIPLPHPNAIAPSGRAVRYADALPVDEHGELMGSKNVYIADAAGLPDVLAGSFTLTIMANAYRIGKRL